MRFVARCALVPLAAALCLLLVCSTGWAKVDVSFHGRTRYRHIGLTDFPVGADGFKHGQESRGTFLLRIDPEIHFSKNFFIRGQIQALDGQAYGDQSRLGGDEILRPWFNLPARDQFELREAYVQIPVGVGILRVGRMMSRWGLGILANGGDDEVYGFADATHGDIVNRAIFMTKPLKPFLKHGRAADALVLALGVDIVEKDEFSNRIDGDDAIEVVGALEWKETDLEFGTYIAYLDLDDKDGRKTKAVAADLYGRWDYQLNPCWTLKLAFEGVLISGTTEKARFEGADFPVDLLQFGAVLRAGLHDENIGYGGDLEIGYASGDNDNADATARGFRFDPGYKVGMILFEEVLARSSARAFDRATDPNLVGTPAQGAELVPTNGSVSNVLYFYPQAHFAPNLGLDLRIGMLFAFAPADVVDPFESAQAGGFNRNPFGKANSAGFLGFEFNSSLSFTFPVSKLFSLRVGGQYGVFKAGPALKAADGTDEIGTLHKWRLLTDLRW